MLKGVIAPKIFSLRGSLLRYVTVRGPLLAPSPQHMGRSEAPLPSDSNGEESLEEPTANVHTRDRRRCSHSCVSGDYGRAFIRVVERIRGVDSKYNEQDGAASKPAVTQFRLLSLQAHPKRLNTSREIGLAKR